MNPEIANVQLQFQCPAAWDQMTPAQDGRHCTQCNKTVYDFTNAQQQEFLQILAEQDGHLCGRFSAAQLAPQPIALHGWKKWVSAALVLVGINVFQQAKAQKVSKPSTDTIVINNNKNIDDASSFGVVETPQPSFPGGLAVMQEFIIKNMHYPKNGKAGKVFATFIVSKTGALKNIRILRGLSKANDDEVIRVLKLMPKWEPAIVRGKPTEVQFALPINFAAQ